MQVIQVFLSIDISILILQQSIQRLKYAKNYYLNKFVLFSLEIEIFFNSVFARG